MSSPESSAMGTASAGAAGCRWAAWEARVVRGGAVTGASAMIAEDEARGPGVQGEGWAGSSELHGRARGVRPRRCATCRTEYRQPFT